MAAGVTAIVRNRGVEAYAAGLPMETDDNEDDSDDGPSATAGVAPRAATARRNPPRTPGASSTPSSWAASNFFPTFILFSISVVPTFFPLKIIVNIMHKANISS